MSFLLVMSILQVAASLQFFAAPTSTFAALSVIVTAMSIGAVWALRKMPREPLVIFTKQDAAGIVTALFFALPFTVLCFWQNDPAHITTFASVEGADGSNHYTAIAEMSKTEHLNYRTADYYPKGFHIASALLLDGFHANQPDQNWVTNARVYVGMFIAWGALLAYLVLYLAVQLTQHLKTPKHPSPLLLALCIGPPLALMYLFTFSQEGFISHYYICAALICGVMYLYEAKPETTIEQWPVVAYLLLVFGIAMSWGPLLTPVLLAIPVLYLWPHFRSLKTLPRRLVSKQWLWITLAFVLQLVPLYLHLKYAHLTSEQGFNATGALKTFHYGPFLAGLALTVYLLCGRVTEEWRKLAGNVLLPLFILVGAFMCIQYLTVGELRYYAIKSSLLLEIILLATAAATAGVMVYQSKMTTIHRWLLLPTIIGLGTVVLAGMTADPFDKAHATLGTLAHNIRQVDPTVRHYTDLGLSGDLSTNVTNLRYDGAGDKLKGNAALTNWTNLMQYTTDGTPASGLCSGKIFALQAYGTGSPDEQNQLITAVKDCIVAAADRHRPYFIVTDEASVPRLRDLFGESATYIY